MNYGFVNMCLFILTIVIAGMVLLQFRANAITLENINEALVDNGYSRIHDMVCGCPTIPYISGLGGINITGFNSTVFNEIG